MMEDRNTESLEEQESENGPVVPGTPPTPEEKKKGRPVKRAIKKALKEIDSEAKADQVAAEIEAAASEASAEDISEETTTPTTVAEAAQKVEQAVAAAPKEETAKEALTETARQVVAAEGREREVLSEVVHEAISPEAAQEEEVVETPGGFLREAILRRMAPYDAVDARLFLAINHLPHTNFANRFFYFLTYVFNGGAAWYALLGLLWFFDRKRGKGVVQTTILPLSLSTMVVEFPVKSYFRRKRPFIKIVQAIVIGKKPGSWSFPSGHSASAFAGAWLLHKHFPKQGPLLYLVASLVAFSRIFLGDHYPGDVVAGSLSGALLAKVFSKLQRNINSPSK
jgi:undecaprenyl-diphosphatase